MNNAIQTDEKSSKWQINKLVVRKSGHSGDGWRWDEEQIAQRMCDTDWWIDKQADKWI